jgi:hypothetical protein
MTLESQLIYSTSYIHTYMYMKMIKNGEQIHMQ